MVKCPGIIAFAFVHALVLVKIGAQPGHQVTDVILVRSPVRCAGKTRQTINVKNGVPTFHAIPCDCGSALLASNGGIPLGVVSQKRFYARAGTAQACTCQKIGPEPQLVYKLNLTLRLPAPSEDAGLTPSPTPVIIFFHGYGGKFVVHINFPSVKTAGTAQDFRRGGTWKGRGGAASA
jgi:hypothetical protein